MSDPTLKKTVNALVPDAPIAPWAKILLYWAVYPTIRAAGGLWVGGSMAVTDREVRFEPNGMNSFFLAGDVSFSVALAAIRSVRVETATGTDIVVMTTDTGERRVRCSGATDLAAAIDYARPGAASG